MAAPDNNADEGGFLTRWSRRKVQVRQGQPVAEPAPVLGNLPDPVPEPRPQGERAPTMALSPAGLSLDGPDTPQTASLPPACAPPPPPTLADVALLDRESDYSRFVAPGVDAGVKNAALKKLFTDPHFNVMDRLDTYIDDYGAPDPLPAGMLRQMAQSQFLGLFDDEKNVDPESVANPPERLAPPAPQAFSECLPAALPAALSAALPEALLEAPSDENLDLRLQPNSAAGPAGPEPGAGPDTGRQR